MFVMNVYIDIIIHVNFKVVTTNVQNHSPKNIQYEYYLYALLCTCVTVHYSILYSTLWIYIQICFKWKRWWQNL